MWTTLSLPFVQDLAIQLSASPIIAKLPPSDAATLGNTPRRIELHLPCCSHTLCLLRPYASPLSLGAHSSWLVVATNARAYGHTLGLSSPPPMSSPHSQLTRLSRSQPS